MKTLTKTIKEYATRKLVDLEGGVYITAWTDVQAQEKPDDEYMKVVEWKMDREIGYMGSKLLCEPFVYLTTNKREEARYMFDADSVKEAEFFRNTRSRPEDPLVSGDAAFYNINETLLIDKKGIVNYLLPRGLYDIGEWSL